MSIYWEIRFRILGKGRFPKTKENIALCLNWNIPFAVLVYVFFWFLFFFAVLCLLVVSFVCSS
jgi:hypothetical protein